MKPTVRADAKLQNLTPEAHDELWALRHPEEEGGRVWTYSDIAAWVPGRFKFSVSVAAVSNFYQWLALKRRMDARSLAVEQFKQALAKDPSFTEDQLKKVGQKLFMAEGIIEKNPRVFASMVDSVQNDTRLEQNREMIKLKKEAGQREARKLALLEAKAAKADQATAITNSEALTEDEKAARIKQLFRMG